jgi:glycosyltransferase involved in cell wall biosynthesis
MDYVRLTVAVPTRDRREALLGALEVIVPQLEEGDELLVVDNGSTDGTHAAVGSWLETEFPRGRVHVEAGGGVSAARNLALREASTPILCFVDDDVRPAAGWLAALRRSWSRAGPNTGAIGGPMRARWLGARPAWLTDHLLYVVAVLELGEESRRLDQRAGTGYVWGGNISVRTEAALSVGGFDEHRGVRPEVPYDRGEEEDLQRRLAGAGFEVWYEPEAVVDHLVPPERVTESSFLRFFRERGLLDAARGRPRREGALALARSVPRGIVFGLARRPEAASARFASAHAWALLTGPRSPQQRGNAL